MTALRRCAGRSPVSNRAAERREPNGADQRRPNGAAEPRLPNGAAEPRLPNRATDPRLPNRATDPRRPNGADPGRRPRRPAELPVPLVWTFDGPFERCLADIEDTLRRAIVLVGDVARIALVIDLSLPALQQRLHAGDAIQPAWGRFVERIADAYGLPAFPRVRHLRTPGPLATLVVAYRS